MEQNNVLFITQTLELYRGTWSEIVQITKFSFIKVSAVLKIKHEASLPSLSSYLESMESLYLIAHLKICVSGWGTYKQYLNLSSRLIRPAASIKIGGKLTNFNQIQFYKLLCYFSVDFPNMLIKSQYLTKFRS